MSNTEDFIKLVKETCENNNIKFNITNYSEINSGWGRGTGFFDGTELRVAGGQNQKYVLGIVAHEFGHLNQFLEKDKTYFCKDMKYFVDWLKGENISDNKAYLGMQAIIRNEKDCEKRGVSYIKKYDLPLNIENYIKQANLYLYSYHWMFRNKKSISTDIFINNSKLVKLMPSHFRNHHDTYIPEYIYKAIDREMKL